MVLSKGALSCRHIQHDWLSLSSLFFSAFLMVLPPLKPSYLYYSCPWIQCHFFLFLYSSLVISIALPVRQLWKLPFSFSGALVPQFALFCGSTCFPYQHSTALVLPPFRAFSGTLCCSSGPSIEALQGWVLIKSPCSLFFLQTHFAFPPFCVFARAVPSTLTTISLVPHLNSPIIPRSGSNLHHACGSICGFGRSRRLIK